MGKKPVKIRLDLFLTEAGTPASPEKAKSEILSGWVKVNGETVRDPARKITGNENIEIERPGGLYVSRGGEKLARALEVFRINLEGKTALDLGASTGGFTDCMLKHGAVKVYAVDVGYNQIDYSLRTDDRVVVMEKTHAKDISSTMFAEDVDFFTADLSFISILKVLPAVYDTFASIHGVVLIKPQFEADPSQHKKGVVKDPEEHIKILARVIEGIKGEGFSVAALTYSPLKGPAGNIEFLTYLKKCRVDGKDEAGSDPGETLTFSDIKQIVDEAHKSLDR